MVDISPINGVFAKAVSEGWIYTLERTPLLAFRPKMTWLITAIRRLLVNEVAHDHGFEEYVFPRMVPEEVLAKTGWLNNHREEAWLVDPKREFIFHPDRADEAGGLFVKASSFPGFPTTPLPYALDPIQCVSLYYALFNKTLEKDEWPVKGFEYQGGWSHRYEKEPVGLLRGIEFLRLELVWIADMQQADTIRTEVLRAAGLTLQEQLGLKIVLAKGDSCFEEPAVSKYTQQWPLQDILKLAKQVASIDIVTDYADRGPVEIGSCGRHDLLPRRFQIKVRETNGTEVSAWSGCLGIGLTRLAAVFLAAHGFDANKWPERIKRYYSEASQKHE